MVLTFNLIVLALLLVILIAEEYRFRSLRRRIVETGGELTALAHELRSPLANLRKYGDFLQSKEFGSLSFSQQEALSKVSDAVRQSVLLLDRFLARSRLEEATISQEDGNQSIRSIVEGAIDAVRSAALRKHHTLTLQPSKDATVPGDPLLLHGIFDEILLNAVSYTPDGGTITVAISHGDRTVSVAIKDTGIGISEDEKPHIFQKFYRGERAKELDRGNGLGLAFAQIFARRFRGSIRFSSQVDKGSLFTVTLPKR